MMPCGGPVRPSRGWAGQGQAAHVQADADERALGTASASGDNRRVSRSVAARRVVEASPDDRLRVVRQELAELAAQQTATVEILNAISQSAFDLAAVLEAIARNAVTLCRADAAQLYRFDGEAHRVVAHFGGPPAYVEFLPRLIVQ